MAPATTVSLPATRKRVLQDYLGLALLLIWALLAWSGYHDSWGDDLGALWFAGHLHATGQDALIYASPPDFFGATPPAWLETLHQIRPGGIDHAFPYIYPPLWTAFLAPLSEHLSPMQFQQLFLAVHLAMLVGSVLLAEKIARPATMSRLAFRAWGVAVLFASAPSFAALDLNQPTIIIGFLCLLAVALMISKPVVSGACLAVASAIKLTPLLFALLYLQIPRGTGKQGLRAGFALGATGLGLGLLSVAVLGWPLHQAFLAQLEKASAHTVWAAMNPSPRILLGDIAAWLGLSAPLDLGSDSQAVLVTLPGWIGKCVALIGLSVIASTLWLARARRGPEARALTTLILAIALFLFGPLSWLHYLVLPLLLLPALFSGLSKRSATLFLGAILLTNNTVVLMQFVSTGLSFLPYTALIAATWSLALVLALRALARQPRE